MVIDPFTVELGRGALERPSSASWEPLRPAVGSMGPSSLRSKNNHGSFEREALKLNPRRPGGHTFGSKDRAEDARIPGQLMLEVLGDLGRVGDDLGPAVEGPTAYANMHAGIRSNVAEPVGRGASR